MTTPPVSLGEFQEYIKNTNPDDAAKLARALYAATMRVEADCGAMTPRTVTALVQDTYYEDLSLPEWPVLEVASVTDATDADDPRLLLRAGGAYRPTQRVVTYTIGRSPVPEALQEATLIVAAQLVESQRGPQRSNNPPSFLGQNAEGSYVARGFALPNRAVELMQPYMIPYVA